MIDNELAWPNKIAIITIGNIDAKVNPPLVIAIPLKILVKKFIGILTSSLISFVIPQYPVCSWSFPLAKFGVINISALN